MNTTEERLKICIQAFFEANVCIEFNCKGTPEQHASQLVPYIMKIVSEREAELVKEVEERLDSAKKSYREHGMQNEEGVMMAYRNVLALITTKR